MVNLGEDFDKIKIGLLTIAYNILYDTKKIASFYREGRINFMKKNINIPDELFRLKIKELAEETRIKFAKKKGYQIYLTSFQK